MGTHTYFALAAAGWTGRPLEIGVCPQFRISANFRIGTGWEGPIAQASTCNDRYIRTESNGDGAGDMESTEALGALLHLGAVTSVLTIAYVGLDRLEFSTAIAQPAFTDRVQELQMRARVLARTIAGHILRQPNPGKLEAQLALLAYFAKLPMQLGWRRWLPAILYRFRRAPLTSYFGSPIDSAVRAVWAATTTATFLVLVGGTVYGACFVENDRLQVGAFWLFTIALIATLATGIAARWYDPKARARIAAEVHAEADAAITAALKEFQEMMDNFIAKGEASLQRVDEIYAHNPVPRDQGAEGEG